MNLVKDVKENLTYEVKQEVGNDYIVVMKTPDFDVAKDKVLRLINKGIKSHMVGTPTGEK